MDDSGRRRRAHERARKKISQSASNSNFPGQTNLFLIDKLKLIGKLTLRKSKLMNKLKSRKFWSTIVGGLVLLFGDNLGLDPEASKWLAGLIGSYVLGQGIADAGAQGQIQS